MSNDEDVGDPSRDSGVPTGRIQRHRWPQHRDRSSPNPTRLYAACCYASIHTCFNQDWVQSNRHVVFAAWPTCHQMRDIHTSTNAF